MAKPNAPELTPQKIDQLASALRDWAERHPNPDAPLLAFAGSTVLTPKQLASEVKERSEDGKAFLRMVQFGLEVMPFEEILARFQH
jgi:hypothetical protein